MRSSPSMTKEGFVRIGMAMPDEVAFDLCDLELIIVELGDDPRLPVAG